MLNGWPAGGVWLSTHPTDMHKSRTILKILAFEAGGYWVWKRGCLRRVDPARCARQCFRGPNFWPLSMVLT